jgi:ferric-dicitrate binding protein FerR (iron transport regulator)
MRALLEIPLSRRQVVAAVPAAMAAQVIAAHAAEPIGSAADIRGLVHAIQADTTRDLANGADVLIKDLVETEEQSFAQLDLVGGTIIHLGSKAKLLIDQFVADAGGVLELGEGGLVFDRAEDLSKIDVSVRSRFGLIAVRGTKFFAGPSRDAFGIFVARGIVDVVAGGERRRLKAGDGVDILAAGEAPGDVKQWGKARIDEALASVGL